MKRRNLILAGIASLAALIPGSLAKATRKLKLFDPHAKTEDVDLCSCMDAQVWAREFSRRYPTMLCQIPGQEGVTNEVEEIMVGWFANSIMAGYDDAMRRASRP